MNNETVQINQAINAGHKVINDAQRVIDSLGSANVWGLFDMFSKHSLLSGILKHSKLDDAQKDMENLKYSLNLFNSELNDVKVYCNVSNVDFDGWMKFFDIFCDNFFVDLYALSKISDSKNQIQRLIDEVRQTIDALNRA